MNQTPLITRRDILHVPRGFLMGIADVIPGVSGGTVALILGIYERLVTAISHVDLEFLTDLRRRRWRRAAAHLDAGFLVLLLSGILLGILSLANVMKHLLEHQRQHTHAVFFGLILASSLLVARLIRLWTPLAIAMLVAGAAFAYWLVGLLPAAPPAGLWYVFVCGMVAICAMILPGISGSFILLILGKYDDILGIIREMTRGQFTGEAVAVLAVFATGCAVGLIGFSKLLKSLLARHYNGTMAVLCGFMVGSLRKIWPFKGVESAETGLNNLWPDLSQSGVWLSLLLICAAFALVIVLDRLSRKV